MTNDVPKFTNFEVVAIMKEVIKNIMKYKPIDIQTMILNCSMKYFIDNFFFFTFEFFNGKSIADLSIADPIIVKEALEKGPSEDPSLSMSLIDQILGGLNEE